MDPGDSKNVYGNPRLQGPNFTLKMSYLRVKFGLCNLVFPYTFLESPGSIDYCYVFGFPLDMPVLTLRNVKTLREPFVCHWRVANYACAE